MAQKIATVFGGTGFLARYIVPKLTKAGYRVRIASRHPSKARHLMTQGDVGQIQADSKCRARGLSGSTSIHRFSRSTASSELAPGAHLPPLPREYSPET